MTTTEASAPDTVSGQPSASVPISFGPYVGPRPFEKAEERLFFGRDREARDLISLIIANRVFILYSQSGAGKSSLLNAKVITGLEKQQCKVLPTARVQGKLPLTLKETQIRNIFSLNALLSLREVAPNLGIEQLSTSKLADFIAPLYQNRADDEDPIVLLFDQFEELFTFYEYRWKDRGLFITEIVEALSKFPELKVVFSLREDYIAKLDSYSREFPDRLRARYLLERLKERPATEAIVGPMETSDRRYDDKVAEAIVQDLLETQSRDIQGNPVTVRGEYVEPVQLQVVCSNLWSSIPADKKIITKRDLENSGSVNQALAKFYEASLTSIASETRVSELEIRRWFEDALVTPAGTRGTVFRDTETTAGMPNRVVDALENCHLIRGDWRAGAQWYEITHDRLLRPIRESNRIWLDRVGQRRRIAFGSIFGVLALCVLIALGWSLESNRQATRRADAQALASSLVGASAQLPQNNLDLALLLAVEAFHAQDSTATRSNLLSQVTRAERVQSFRRFGPRDFASNVAIPDSDLVASISSERTLLVWTPKGGVQAKYILGGDSAFNVFADRDRIYAIPKEGSAVAFGVAALKRGEGLQTETANPELVSRIRSGLAASRPAPNVDSSQSNLLLQKDPRTVVLAGSTLLTGNDEQLVVTGANGGNPITLNLTSGNAASEIPGRAGNPRRIKLIDVGLSSDARFAYAIVCEVDDIAPDKGKIISPQSQSPNACGATRARFWQIEGSNELFRFTSRFDNPQTVAIKSSDGFLWIAVGKSDGSVTATKFQLSRGDPITVASASLEAGSQVTDLLFSDSPAGLVSISGGGLAISWNLDGVRRLERAIHNGTPYDISVAGNGTVASIGTDGFSVLGKAPAGLLLSGNINPRTTFTSSADSFSAIALDREARNMLVAQAGSIQLWDVGLRLMKGSVKIAPGGTVSVALDPLAQFLAAGYMPPSIVEEGKKAADRTAASIDYSRTPVLWKTSDQQPALFIDLAAHPPPVAAGTDPPRDTADKPVASSPSPNDTAKAAVGVAFSPDGRYFVVTSGDIGAGGSITFYERRPSTRQEAIFEQLKSSPEFTTASTPYFAAFSGDGRLLAVSQQSGETLLIDVETKRQQGKLPSATGEIGRLAFSPDGALLGTISFDNRLTLWDIATRTPFGRPIALGDATGPLGIAFAPDGRWLFTADANLNSLVAFDLDVVSWVNQACDVAGRQLSDQERSTYKLPPDLRVGCAPR